MKLAEVFANPVTLAEAIQKLKDNVWTSAEWETFCDSLKPFKDMLRAVHDEAYEEGETVGFDDGESEGYERAEKDYGKELDDEKEKSYDEGYEAAKKEFSHPINTPNSLKG